MENNKVSKNFSSNKYTQAQLKVKADHIIDEMTDNPHFPTPSPTLEVLTTASANYGNALEKAQNGNKEDTVLKNNAKEELIALLKQMANYVQMASAGNEAIILSSGFNVNKKPSLIGPLPKATNLKVSMAPNRGSVLLSCKVIKKARVYVFEYTHAPVNNDSVWTKAVSTKHNTQIDGLNSGQQYVFRVAGAASDPTRNWSDQISSYVL